MRNKIIEEKTNPNKSGFTIIELIIVIMVMGILSSIAFVSYNGWKQSTTVAQLKSDLNGVAAAMENARNFSDSYPSSFPNTFRPTNGTVLQFAIASAGNYCVNAYSTESTNLLMSYDSLTSSVRQFLCSGLVTGTPIGGTVPTAPRNVNLAGDFSNWTLSGGATYNKTTGEMVLGVNGVAASPLIRVDKPVMMNLGGDFYATVASAYPTITPNGGWHTNSAYYAADGVTPVMNSWNYTGNGCASAITLNTWSINNTGCGYAGGPNVVYSQFVFYSSSYGYASSDLKIKNPRLTITD